MSLLTADDLGAIGLSLRVAGCAIVCALPLALLVAYALSRSRLAGRVLLDAATTLPLVLPPVATGYFLLILFGRAGPIGGLLAHLGITLAFRWTGAALAAAVMSFPLMVRPMRLAMEAIEPEVEEAALTLGAPPLVRFFRLTLPLAAPGVAAGVVLGFAKALGEFGATIMVAGNIAGKTQTIPLAIYTLRSRPEGMQQAWRLVGLSILLAAAALAAGRWLEMAHKRTG